MQFLAIYLYVMAVGFVSAGLLASFVQLVSGQPMRFGIEPNSIMASLGGVLLRVLGRPCHSHAQRMARLADSIAAEDLVRPFAAIAAVWSLFSGARAARSDPDAVSEPPLGKKGAGLFAETGSSKGPVGSGMGGG